MLGWRKSRGGYALDADGRVELANLKRRLALHESVSGFTRSLGWDRDQGQLLAGYVTIIAGRSGESRHGDSSLGKADPPGA